MCEIMSFLVIIPTNLFFKIMGILLNSFFIKHEQMAVIDSFASIVTAGLVMKSSTLRLMSIELHSSLLLLIARASMSFSEMIPMTWFWLSTTGSPVKLFFTSFFMASKTGVPFSTVTTSVFINLVISGILYLQFLHLL